MKIEKYGEVIVSEEDVVVTGFIFNGEGDEARRCYICALEFAKKRIEEEKKFEIEMLYQRRMT